MQFPADGVRYLENEQRYTVAAGGGRVRAFYVVRIVILNQCRARKWK